MIDAGVTRVSYQKAPRYGRIELLSHPGMPVAGFATVVSVYENPSFEELKAEPRSSAFVPGGRLFKLGGAFKLSSEGAVTGRLTVGRRRARTSSHGSPTDSPHHVPAVIPTGLLATWPMLLARSNSTPAPRTLRDPEIRRIHRRVWPGALTREQSRISTREMPRRFWKPSAGF
jgi:hypothetical protein